MPLYWLTIDSYILSIVISATGPFANTPKYGVIATFLNATSASFASPTNVVFADDMVKNGFALIYANCSDFFLSVNLKNGEKQDFSAAEFRIFNLMLHKSSIKLTGLHLHH